MFIFSHITWNLSLLLYLQYQTYNLMIYGYHFSTSTSRAVMFDHVCFLSMTKQLQLQYKRVIYWLMGLIMAMTGLDNASNFNPYQLYKIDFETLKNKHHLQWARNLTNRVYSSVPHILTAICTWVTHSIKIFQFTNYQLFICNFVQWGWMQKGLSASLFHNI